jgi:tetratricopeptide (TPR) repeat protein
MLPRPLQEAGLSQCQPDLDFNNTSLIGFQSLTITARNRTQSYYFHLMAKRKKFNPTGPRSSSQDLSAKSIPSWQTLIYPSLLFLINLAAYAGSFNAGWHFDDLSNICSNRAVHLKDLSWEGFNTVLTTRIGGRRPVAYLTFALNYYFSELNVLPYHVVNFIIHCANAYLVFLLIFSLGRRWQPEIRKTDLRLFSFFAAALWSTSPLQTQAVTYVVQRMTSLAATFFLVSTISYIRWRSELPTARRWFWLVACVCCSVLAFCTKENAFILPAVFVVYELYSVREWHQLRSKAPAIGWLCLSIAGLGAFVARYYQILDKIQIDYAGRDFTMQERVLTQFRVVVFHLRQLIFPLPSQLAVHHEFDKSQSLFVPVTTILSLLFILGTLTVAIRLKQRQPLLSFFIVWYFLTLVIESTVLPLELIFEHRVYLPSIGFFVALLWPLLYWPGAEFSRRHMALTTSAVSLAICLSVWMTFVRNEVWKDDITLWSDSLRKYPNSFRIQNNVATAYANNGQLDLAEAAFRESARLKPDKPDTKVNLALLCLNQGRLEEALQWVEGIDQRNLRGPLVFFNLGVIYMKQGDLSKAIEFYQRAIRENPDYAEAHFNLGLACLRTKNLPFARTCFDIFLKKFAGDPGDPQVQQAQTYLKQLSGVE